LADTNILLQVLREREKAKICADFLEKYSRKSAISSFSLSSFCIRSELFKQEEQAHNLISELFKSGLTVIQTESILSLQALIQKKAFGLSYDDYIQYFTAKENNLTLVTLDKDFTKKKLDITVKKPDQVA
jgi:uncharacterized protein